MSAPLRALTVEALTDLLHDSKTDVTKQKLSEIDFSGENFPQANMLIPKIALVIAIMNRFEIPRVTYCATNGNTEGMLLF